MRRRTPAPSTDGLVLSDTSGLLCVHHTPEPGHAMARAFLANASRVVTHNYVLAEFVALIHARRLSLSASMDFLARLVANPRVEIVWVDEELHGSAMSLLRQRPDKTYSLCDAVSFVVMRRHGITRALTTDRHFEQEGFQRLLR